MRICYFGIYDPEFSRNKVYMSGLRGLGHEIIECRDSSRGLAKYFRLWRRHRAVMKSGGYDAMIVGYPGHIVVPFAKMLSKKPVIFDALCSLYEGEVISRGKYRFNIFMKSWIRFIDAAAVKAADIVLVETDAQRAYFLERFGLDAARIFRVFTGTDESVFFPRTDIKKRVRFTAVFRGKFLPEAGVRHILNASKILKAQDIDVLIIGNGHLQEEVREQVRSGSYSNLEWMSGWMTPEDLVKTTAECHVALGQFEDHDRLSRTIPHKAFEALAMRMPYVTARTGGISELLTDRKDCLMVAPADPKDLAAKVIELKNDPALAPMLADNGRALFESRLTSKELAEDIVHAITAQKLRLRI